MVIYTNYRRLIFGSFNKEKNVRLKESHCIIRGTMIFFYHSEVMQQFEILKRNQKGDWVFLPIRSVCRLILLSRGGILNLYRDLKFTWNHFAIICNLAPFGGYDGKNIKSKMWKTTSQLKKN